MYLHNANLSEAQTRSKANTFSLRQSSNGRENVKIFVNHKMYVRCVVLCFPRIWFSRGFQNGRRHEAEGFTNQTEKKTTVREAPSEKSFHLFNLFSRFILKSGMRPHHPFSLNSQLNRINLSVVLLHSPVCLPSIIKVSCREFTWRKRGTQFETRKGLHKSRIQSLSRPARSF